MQNQTGPSSLYENIVTVSFLLFLKSMELYAELGNQAVFDPKIIQNPKVRKGLAQIIETIDACGNGLGRLPEPPLGAEAADKLFRELGKDISTLSVLLNDLSRSDTTNNPKLNAENFRELTERLKQNYREAIMLFERAYPGRLTSVLQSQPQTQ